MSDRPVYRCTADDCDIQILIDSPDPQAIGLVYCDCTHRMEIVGHEDP